MKIFLPIVLTALASTFIVAAKAQTQQQYVVLADSAEITRKCLWALLIKMI